MVSATDHNKIFVCFVNFGVHLYNKHACTYFVCASRIVSPDSRKFINKHDPVVLEGC